MWCASYIPKHDEVRTTTSLTRGPTARCAWVLPPLLTRHVVLWLDSSASRRKCCMLAYGQLASSSRNWVRSSTCSCCVMRAANMFLTRLHPRAVVAVASCVVGIVQLSRAGASRGLPLVGTTLVFIHVCLGAPLPLCARRHRVWSWFLRCGASRVAWCRLGAPAVFATPQFPCTFAGRCPSCCGLPNWLRLTLAVFASFLTNGSPSACPCWLLCIACGRAGSSMTCQSRQYS